MRKNTRARKTKRKARKTRRRQRGGSYPGMLVTAKPTTSEIGDPDSVPTVMRHAQFSDQVDREGDSVPS